MAERDSGQRWEIQYVSQLGEQRTLCLFSLANAVQFVFAFADEHGIACTVVDRQTGSVAIRMVATPVGRFN